MPAVDRADDGGRLKVSFDGGEKLSTYQISPLAQFLS